ncbi:MFS transporter [Cytobacillus oceanisediminis]|uniref:MFS transporter n=1 Tax=Cytobacillus oceanisediminis TaxID=665099 RepID=UPI001CCF41E3|nr:MFS transporter [Cytobacillus oceanisediminis]MBZ9535641.1 MFS transporter [Cytobacillus oceanisediminis]
MNSFYFTEESKEKREQRVTLRTLFFGGLLVVSSLYVTIPLLNALMATYKIQPLHSGWSSSIFSFCYAVGLIFFGLLSVKVQRYHLFLVCFIGMTFITPFISLSPNYVLFLIFRGIQGFIAASFAPNALGFALEWFPVEKKVLAIAWINTGFLLAGIIGPFISSSVLNLWNWQAVFIVFGILYFLMLIFIFYHLPKTSNHQIQVENQNFILQMKELLAKKHIYLCYWITATLLFSYVSFSTFIDPFLKEQAFTPTTIFNLKLVGMIGVFFTLASNFLIKLYGKQLVLRSGLLIAIFSICILAFLGSKWLIGIAIILFIGGISVSIPANIALIQEWGGKHKNLAITCYTVILFIGASIAPVFSIYLIEKVTISVGMIVLSAILLSSFTSSLFIRPRTSSKQLKKRDKI